MWRKACGGVNAVCWRPCGLCACSSRRRGWAVGLQTEPRPALSRGLPPSSLQVGVTEQMCRPKCDWRREGAEAAGPRGEPGTRRPPGGRSGCGAAGLRPHALSSRGEGRQ